MKNLIYAIFGIGLVFGLLFYLGVFDSSDEQEQSEKAPPAPPPPPPDGNQYGPNTGIGSGINPASYFIDQGEGKDQVNNRMKALYRDRVQREQIIRENNVLTNRIFDSLQYPEGMQQIVYSSFGSVAGMPITPPTVDGGAFIEQMEALQNLKNINTLERGGKLEFAKTQYKNVATLPDGQTFWPRDLETYLDQGLFGPGSRADSNKSNLWDRYGEDLKTLAGKLVNASLDFENVLRAKAVADLEKAGWNFVNA